MLEHPDAREYRRPTKLVSLKSMFLVRTGSTSAVGVLLCVARGM